MLTIALPKGRIADETLEIFRKIFGDGFAFDNRKLIMEQGNFRFLLVRNQDVPTYVTRGAADLGVVGEDVLSEKEPPVTKLLDLKIGKCRVAIGVKVGQNLDLSKPKIVVASKMVNITRKFFDTKAISVEIVQLYGSIELAPLVDLADAIVDVVETGTTMKENGLEPTETIMYSTAKLFANRESFIEKNEEILTLRDKIEAAL